LAAVYHVIIHRDPIVTGTSVVGLKYKDGVMIISDTLSKNSNPNHIISFMSIYVLVSFILMLVVLVVLASYGSMPRFKSIDRIRKVPNADVGVDEVGKAVDIVMIGLIDK
jgi:hypothetical protein